MLSEIQRQVSNQRSNIFNQEFSTIELQFSFLVAGEVRLQEDIKIDCATDLSQMLVYLELYVPVGDSSPCGVRAFVFIVCEEDVL